MAESKPQAQNTPPEAPKPRPATPRPGTAAGTRTPAPAPARPKRRWRRPDLSRLYNNATLVIVTGAIIVVVLGVVAFGYWDSYIRPARATAVSVGGRSYDMIYFTRRLETQLQDPSLVVQSAAQVAQMPDALAQDILDEEVFVQRAGTLGVSVSDQEIDESLAERLRIPFTKDDSGRIQHTPTFENGVRAYLQRGGLTLAELRRSVHGARLRQEVGKRFESAIPEALPAVRIRQITVADEEKAKQIKAQLDGGADFADLAGKESQDTATKSQGGLRDWTPQGLLPAELEGPASSLPVGQASDPIKSGSSYTIFKVEERTDSRQVSDKDRAALASRQLDDWLKQQRNELKARSYLDEGDRVTYALEHSGAREAVARAAGARGRGGTTLPPINIPTGGGAGGQAPAGGTGGNP